MKSTTGAIVDGPNQLWVADITYIAIATGLREGKEKGMIFVCSGLVRELSNRPPSLAAYLYRRISKAV